MKICRLALCFAFSIAVKEVDSKHSQISRSVINFEGVSSPFEKTSKIQVLFKEFKDLNEP